MKIKIAIVDSRISAETERKLTLHGYRVLTLPPFSKLSKAVASHPDMLIRKIGNEYISYADYCDEAAYVFSDLSVFSVGTGSRFTFTADEVGEAYPSDVGLNALEIGGKLFCRVASASGSMLDSARRTGLEIVNVNQGYPACTVLKLNDSAAITADVGMAKILEKHGIRVTLIEQGDISLPPHEYGFIGGASGTSSDTIYFCGNLDLHPDYKKIISFISERGKKCVFLPFKKLTDMGSILFI